MTDLTEALARAEEMLRHDYDLGAGYAAAYGFLRGAIKTRIDEEAARLGVIKGFCEKVGVRSDTDSITNLALNLAEGAMAANMLQAIVDGDAITCGKKGRKNAKPKEAKDAAA